MNNLEINEKKENGKNGKVTKKMIGIIFLVFTVIVWGTTFLATKTLLIDFTPIEILMFRYTLAFVALFCIKPRIFKWKGWKFEGLCLLAAISSITLYQYLENVSLVYSTASNVSIIISCAAFFTAIFSFFILKDEKIGYNFFLGFIISIAGVCLVSFNGVFNLKLNPKGDVLALIASILWGLYSVVVKIISKKKYDLIMVTRRIMLYGVVTLIPMFIFSGSKLDLSRFLKLDNTLLMVYLGLVGSAICFCTWNYAVDHVGTVKTSLGVYAIPVVTVIFASFLLDEKLTLIGGIGALITIVGLYISSVHFLDNFINAKKAKFSQNKINDDENKNNSSQSIKIA